MTFSTDRRVASRTLAAPLITRETVPTPKPDAAATSAIVARRAADIVTLPKGTGWNRFHQRTRSSSLRAAASSRVCYKRVTRERAPGLPGNMPANRVIDALLIDDLGDRDLQDVPRPGRLQRRDQRVDPALGHDGLDRVHAAAGQR